MSNHWFRYHANALHNPRVRKLPDDLFRIWINSMCIVCLEGESHNGKLPPIEDCADMLRMDVDSVVQNFDKLHEYGLLMKQKLKQNETKSETKSCVSSQKNVTNYETDNETFQYEYKITNWRKKQYKSDTSTSRVRKHRQKKETKNETSNETAPESESNTKQSRANQKGDFLNFDIEDYLDDKSRAWAKENSPGWDQQYLIKHYNLMVNNGQFDIPDKPGPAFAGWCKSFTKGKPPE